MKRVIYAAMLMLLTAASWGACMVSDEVALAKAGYTKAEIAKKCSESGGAGASTASASTSAHRVGEVFRDCPDCPEMVIIPAGNFEMGSNYGDTVEKPAHSVRIPQFALGKYEVTQGQWRAVMDSNHSYFKNCGDDCPVERVSWDDAQKFIRKLNTKTGKTYRLPSEAEWEYACRAGGRHEFCGSNDHHAMVAWIENNSGSKTHAAGQKQANAFGLYDMTGNVKEWVQDCWNDDYHGAPTDGSAWTSGMCENRVLRGGSWVDVPLRSRVAKRTGVEFISHYYHLDGFRLARKLP